MVSIQQLARPCKWRHSYITNPRSLISRDLLQPLPKHLQYDIYLSLPKFDVFKANFIHQPHFPSTPLKSVHIPKCDILLPTMIFYSLLSVTTILTTAQISYLLCMKCLGAMEHSMVWLGSVS